MFLLCHQNYLFESFGCYLIIQAVLFAGNKALFSRDFLVNLRYNCLFFFDRSMVLNMRTRERNPKIPILVIKLSTTTENNRYLLRNLNESFQLWCSQTEAISLPTSSTPPMIIIASLEPGNMVARPITLKYAAVSEIDTADKKVRNKKHLNFPQSVLIITIYNFFI